MRVLIIAIAVVGAGIATSVRAEEGFGPILVAAASQSFKVAKLQLTALRNDSLLRTTTPRPVASTRAPQRWANC